MGELRRGLVRRGQVLAPLTSSSIPFFSRLGVKHGIVLVALVLVTMTITTTQQLTETVEEIRRAAIKKGEGVAAIAAPLIVSRLKSGDGKSLEEYFGRIARNDGDIDYLQIVNAAGEIEFTSDGKSQPEPLQPRWILSLPDKERLDARASPIAWSGGKPGADIFIALLDEPESATHDELARARHLRIGVNLNSALREDTPRLVRKIVIFTLAVTLIMALGLIILLRHVLRPLRELHLGLRAVSAGNLEYEVPVFSGDEMGRVAGAFNATVSKLRSAFEQIEALATHDALTNLPNRRMFDERLASEAARSRRYGHPFGLIVIDLDCFKTINDRFGHPAGDEVLKAVAMTIETSVRETDLPARIGGEEFAVILPESEMEDIKSVAEKLRSSIEFTEFPRSSGVPAEVRVTISAGAAYARGGNVMPETIMSAADGALYQSKNNGRNCVTAVPLCESVKI